MLTIRDHQTGDLFDPWAFLGEKRRKLLEQSWAGVFRKHLLRHLELDELAAHFHPDFGRPGKDLYVAVGALILQQLHDLTDAATVEAVAFNMACHYALDLRDEADAYLCERTLRNYRRMIIAHDLDEALFRHLTDELIRAFGVDTTKQRIDSTSIRSAMRTLTRLGTVVETISKLLRERARLHPALHRQVHPEVLRRYVDREGDGCFALACPSESKRRLPEAGKDLWDLMALFKPTEASALGSFRLLEQVFHEQFEVVDTTDEQGQRSKLLRIKEPAEIPCDNVHNPSDPDSSYNTYRGHGYAAQIMEKYQEDDEDHSPAASPPDLITHVAIHDRA